MSSQRKKAKARSRNSLLSQDAKWTSTGEEDFFDYKFSFTNIGHRRIIDSIWPILHASENMKKVLGERQVLAYKSLGNFELDELVRAKLNGESNGNGGTKKCLKIRMPNL